MERQRGARKRKRGGNLARLHTVRPAFHQKPERGQSGVVGKGGKSGHGSCMFHISINMEIMCGVNPSCLHAAVDRKHLAVHETARRSAQIPDQSGNFLGLAEAADRNVRAVFLDMTGHRRIVVSRGNRSR